MPNIVCQVDKPAKPKYHPRPPPPPKGNKRALGNLGNRKPRGRFLDPVFCQRIELAYRAGMTDVEVSNLVGITTRSLRRYKEKKPETLSGWLDAADEVVERSLFKRATGYQAPDVHVSSYEGAVTVTPIEKHYPPDTAAATFWLKNRKPEEWGEREQVDQKLVNINITFGNPPVTPPHIDIPSENQKQLSQPVANQAMKHNDYCANDDSPGSIGRPAPAPGPEPTKRILW